MEHIQELLKKKNATAPIIIRIRDIFPRVVKDMYQLSIHKNDIRVVRSTLYLDTEPVIKQKIRQHKKQLLAILKKENISVSDII